MFLKILKQRRIGGNAYPPCRFYRFIPIFLLNVLYCFDTVNFAEAGFLAVAFIHACMGVPAVMAVVTSI